MGFRVDDIVQTVGRPLCTALRLLLSQHRLLSLARYQRLAMLLEGSRNFQNEVSERLAEQVLHALCGHLRGFQAAHDASGGEILRGAFAENPDEIYRALLTRTTLSRAICLEVPVLANTSSSATLAPEARWIPQQLALVCRKFQGRSIELGQAAAAVGLA